MANDRIWVLNSEYNRVRRADQAAARIRRNAEQDLRNARERLRSVNNQYAVENRYLSEQIQNEADRLASGIDALSADMQREIQQYVRETQQQMDTLRRSISDTQIRAEEIDRKINDLSAQVSERFRLLADAAARERQRAQMYTNQYAALLDRIRLLHPEKLTPGVLEQDFAPAADFLQMDLTNGDYQAAIGVAQSKLPDAEALRIRLELLNAKFEELRMLAQDAMGSLGERIRRLSNPQENAREISIGDTVFEYNGDLQYWTNGLLGDALQNYEDTCSRYRSAETEMDLDGMELCLRYFDQVEIQLTACEDFAQEEFRLFGMIMNISNRIYDSLTKDEAWTLLESGFADDDARRSYQMSYTDGDDNVASFVVLPNREISQYGNPGQIQFLTDVTNSIRPVDPSRCACVRNGILGRLIQDKIDIGEHNRHGRYSASADQETFLIQATAQGDRIKDDRVTAVREHMQLISQTEE